MLINLCFPILYTNSYLSPDQSISYFFRQINWTAMVEYDLPLQKNVSLCFLRYFLFVAVVYCENLDCRSVEQKVLPFFATYKLCRRVLQRVLASSPSAFTSIAKPTIAHEDKELQFMMRQTQFDNPGKGYLNSCLGWWSHLFQTVRNLHR